MSNKLKKLSNKEKEIMQEQFGPVLVGETAKPYSLAVVLNAVKRSGKEVTKVKDNEYKTLCPCHNDTDPSLSIGYDENSGKVLLHCHSCSPKKQYTDFLTAWGLSPADLVMPEQRHISIIYDYTDEDGNLLYQNVRYEPKDFRHRRPDGKGNWTWDMNGVDRVLYNLPGLAKPMRPGRSVFFVEGEKDCNTLIEHGYAATTSGNTRSWRPEFAAVLKGKKVVIVPDQDAPGLVCAQTVAHDLYGVAASVKVVNPPFGKDITVYFEQDGTVELLDELVSKTPVLTEKPATQKSKQFDFEEFGSMELKETHWLWENRIPLGMFSLIIGNQDVGKSVLSLFIAGVVSTGGSWPDAPNEKIPVGSVLILSAEDDRYRIINPRLKAAGVSGSKIYNISSMTETLPDGQVKTGSVSNLTTDLEALANAIDQIGDVRLIIIDPITAFAGGKKENSNAATRDYLNPLIELAASRNVAIVGLSHLNKNAKVESTYRTLGSIAWTAAARAVWLVAFDPKVDGRRVFVPIKSNLSRGRTGLAFTLVNTDIVVGGKTKGYPACKFESEVVEMTADDALDPESRKKTMKKIDQCVEWLEEYLLNGPQTADNIFTTGKANSMSEATINRAKAKLSIKSTGIQNGAGKFVNWEWAL